MRCPTWKPADRFHFVALVRIRVLGHLCCKKDLEMGSRHDKEVGNGCWIGTVVTTTIKSSRGLSFPLVFWAG